MSPRKAYLGDGCYVDFDGFALVLTTENGITTTNRVVLEPEVYAALVQYVTRLRAKDEAVAVDRCPGCGVATHASESDDLGRCAECAAADGEPHAAAEGKA